MLASSLDAAEELRLALQREVTTRLVLGALREMDAANAAMETARDVEFLDTESARLGASLDEGATLAAMRRMALPSACSWCIVDIRDGKGETRRLSITHPDPSKQCLIAELEGQWLPHPDDGFGLAAIQRSGGTDVYAPDIVTVLAESHDPAVHRIVGALGSGSVLTVALLIADDIVGAVTFVSGEPGKVYSASEIEMAQNLASRSAHALDRARVHGEAIALRIVADAANEAKGAFLGMMSHELRTPLNAIGGYVDLIDLEIHGPVTTAQRGDLARIRTNQKYLVRLVADLLDFAKIGSGKAEYRIQDVDAGEAIATSVALVEPLIASRGLVLREVACGTGMLARGDRERISQILVNLLSNAIKFTPAGGELVMECTAHDDVVGIRVRDSGIGIPADKLEAIFEPFVQVARSPQDHPAGVGLGLAISRELARAMHGELTVESELGAGACFTLVLPRASRLA